MSVNNVYEPVVSIASGATVFPFPYKFFQDEDIVVSKTDANGNTTNYILNTDYVVSGAGEDEGGSVTFTVAPANGLIIAIQRILDLDQPIELVNNDPFDAAVFEDELDRIVMQLQQISATSKAALRFPDTDDPALVSVLPAASVRAGKKLSFDSLGNVAVTASEVVGSYRGTWVTGTQYNYGDTFIDNAQSYYIVLVGHVSTTIAADVAAGKVEVLQNMGTAVASAAASAVSAATSSTQAQAAAASTVGLLRHGECYLTSSNNTTLKLLPLNGRSLIVDSQPQLVPLAGVTLDVSAATTGNTYYIYAAFSAGNLVLSYSANVPVQDANGIMVQTGFGNQTLVGAFQMGAGVIGFVSSYFNRKLRGFLSNQNAVTTTSTTFTNIANGFSGLAWGGDAIRLSCFGFAACSTAAGHCSIAFSNNTAIVGTATSAAAAAQNSIYVEQYLAGAGSGIAVISSALSGLVSAGTGTFTLAFTMQVMG